MTDHPSPAAPSPAVPSAWIDLGERELVRVTGGDRARFLNGMLSHDVAKLPPGRVLPVLQLDRKGHVLSEGWAWALEDALLLDLAPGTATAVLELLERHQVADDVAFERLPDWSQRSFEGEGGRRALEATGLPLPARGTWVAAEGVWLAGEGWLGGESSGIRMLGPREALAAHTPPELPRLSGEALELARIECFVPLYGRDLSARSFPQEARLDRALSYTKGCFLGQEIVARIHSRGAVNRLLVQLECAGIARAGEPIARPGPGAAAGTLTSAAPRPGGGSVALGYVKSELAEPGTELRVAGEPARVSGPPA